MLEMEKKLKEEYYNKLVELNTGAKHDDMAELMLNLQDDLIERGYMTQDLKKTESSNTTETLSLVTDVFLEIRREYQHDDEPITDFSYLSVAWEWLVKTGVEINNGLKTS